MGPFFCLENQQILSAVLMPTKSYTLSHMNLPLKPD
ncbi:MAG: hypothetical protein ACI9LY_000627 [Arenicella sp.]|jgi:hypothetical protein